MPAEPPCVSMRIDVKSASAMTATSYDGDRLEPRIDKEELLDTPRRANYNPSCLPMKRRAVLRSFLALPVAAALPSDALPQEVKASPPDTPKILTTEADSAAVPTVRTFDSAQFSALRKLGEILMPAAQNTPGALEASAPEFLDFLIGVSPPDRVSLYKAGLDRLTAEAHSRYNRSFGEITAAEAEPILAPPSCAMVVSRSGGSVREVPAGGEKRFVDGDRKLARVRHGCVATAAGWGRSGSILVSR